MDDRGVLKNDAKLKTDQDSLQDEVGVASSRQSVGVFGDYRNDGKSGVVSSITIDGKPVILNDFFGLPGTTPMSLDRLMVTSGKFYNKNENIVDFVDSKLMDDWKVTVKWDNWLAEQNLNDHIENETIVSHILEDLASKTSKDDATKYSVFLVYGFLEDNDGLKTTIGPLSDSDLQFLHLIGTANHFGLLKGGDLIFYVRECRCHEESVRLMRKYDTSDIDKDVIELTWYKRKTRRSLEIAIFISQYFGRAELVMQESEVKALWDSLDFMNDFMKIVEVQCKAAREHSEPTDTSHNVDFEPSSDEELSIVGQTDTEAGTESIVKLEKSSVQIAKSKPDKRKRRTNPKVIKSKKPKQTLKLVSGVPNWLYCFVVLSAPLLLIIMSLVINIYQCNCTLLCLKAVLGVTQT